MRIGIKMTFDSVVDDSKKVAHKGIGVLVGLGGIVAGIGLAMSDIGLGLVDQLMDLVKIESDLIANALVLLIGIIILVVVLSLKAMVSSAILNYLFTFLAVMVATYLIVKVITLVMDFLKGDVDVSTDVGA